MIKKILFFSLAFLIVLGTLETMLALTSYLFPRIKYYLDPSPQRRPVSFQILSWDTGWTPTIWNTIKMDSGTVPGQAEIVTLGDSQTYVWGIPPRDSWPSKVGTLSGLKTYNMGVGAYGPVQETLLLDQAFGL